MKCHRMTRGMRQLYTGLSTWIHLKDIDFTGYQWRIEGRLSLVPEHVVQLVGHIANVRHSCVIGPWSEQLAGRRTVVSGIHSRGTIRGESTPNFTICANIARG